MTLIVAAIQWADPRTEIDPITGEARSDLRRGALPDVDAAALEIALALAESWGGEVLAVTAGPPAADQALREARAAGAARVVRIDLPADTPQPEIAAGIAGVVADAGAAMVCCGAAGPDRASGSVPAFLAHRLGAAQALGLVSVEPATMGELTGVRRLDGGRRELFRIAAPAVISVEGAVARLRRASLSGELAARSLTVEVSGPGGAPAHGVPSRSRMLPYRPRPRVVPPPTGDTPAARIGALVAPVVTLARAEPEILDPAAAADRLLDVLRQWGEIE